MLAAPISKKKKLLAHRSFDHLIDGHRGCFNLFRRNWELPRRTSNCCPSTPFLTLNGPQLGEHIREAAFTENGFGNLHIRARYGDFLELLDIAHNHPMFPTSERYIGKLLASLELDIESERARRTNQNNLTTVENGTIVLIVFRRQLQATLFEISLLLESVAPIFWVFENGAHQLCSKQPCPSIVLLPRHGVIPSGNMSIPLRGLDERIERIHVSHPNIRRYLFTYLLRKKAEDIDTGHYAVGINPIDQNAPVFL